jgi:hypothetical protein
VSEIDPTELSASNTHVPETFGSDPVELQPLARKEREGLPPGYRMRADAHYVEHLTSRRSDRSVDHLRVAPEPAERHDSRDRAAQLLAQLAEDFATLDTAAAALTGETSRMARRVNVDLIKAQVWRAGWALRAHALVDGHHRFHARPRPLGFLLGHIRSGWTPECRLEDITLDVNASDWNAVVPVDEQAFITGVNGAIVATLGLLSQVDGASLVVTATCVSGELGAIEIRQDEVVIPAATAARFFDPSWSDRPGGWFAALGAAAARAVAMQHGGDAVLAAGDRRGSTLRITFR